MTVVLEPPLTRSGPWMSPGVQHEALATAPRYVRTGGMGRWHRPRSGMRITYEDRGPHVVYHLWCGPSAFPDRGILTAEAVPAGEPACGTCEGRACGAGQDDWPGDTALIFSPWRLTRPKNCPGSRKEHLAAWASERQNIMRCLVCGDLVKGRVSGGPYNSIFGPENHEPGPALVPGCPFHAWNYPVVSGGTVVCACKAAAS